MIVVMHGSYCDIYFVLHFTAPWSVQLKFTFLIYILRCLQHYAQKTAHTVLPTVLFCFNSNKAELLITADTSLLMKSIKGTTSDFKMRSLKFEILYLFCGPNSSHSLLKHSTFSTFFTWMSLKICFTNFTE